MTWTWKEIKKSANYDALNMLIYIEVHGEKREAEEIIDEYMAELGHIPIRDEISDFIWFELPWLMHMDYSGILPYYR